MSDSACLIKGEWEYPSDSVFSKNKNKTHERPALYRSVMFLDHHRLLYLILAYERSNATIWASIRFQWLALVKSSLYSGDCGTHMVQVVLLFSEQLEKSGHQEWNEQRSLHDKFYSNKSEILLVSFYHVGELFKERPRSIAHSVFFCFVL